MQPNQEKKAERGKLWEELGPEKYAKECLGIGPSQYKKYRKAFSLMDAGGEGSISKKEFIFMLDKFQLGTALSKQECSDLFDRLDKGGSLTGELSGEIDFKEFLDNLDRNNLDKSLAGIIPAILSKEELIEKEVKKIRKTIKKKKSDDKSPSAGDQTPKEVVVKASQKIIEEIEITREDYKKNKKAFRAIDKDSKGSFDREEFGKALKVYLIWQNCSEEYIDEVYNKLYKTEAGNVDLLCFLRSLKNQDNKDFILWINVLLYLIDNANQGVETEKLIKESNSLFLIEIKELKEIIDQKDAELEEFRRKEAQYLKELEESKEIINVLRAASYSHIEEAEYEKLSFQEKINLFNKDFSKKSEQTEEKAKRSAKRKDSSSSSDSDKSDKDKKDNQEVDALKLRIQELEKELAESREELTTVQTQKTEIEVIHDDMIQAVANLRQQLSEKNQEISALQSSSTESQDLHVACQEQIGKLNQIIESLKEQLTRMVSREEFEAIKQSEESFTQIVATLKTEIQTLQGEKTIIEGREAELNLLIEDLRRQLKEAKETQEKRRKGSNDSASSKSSKSSKSEDDLKEEIEKLHAQIRTMVSREDFESSQHLIVALKEEIQILKVELETTIKIKTQLEVERSQLLVQITQLQSQVSVKIEEFKRSTVSSRYTSFEEYYQMYMSTVHGGQDYNCTTACYCHEAH